MSAPNFHAGHAMALHMVIELAASVPPTGHEKADTNVRNALARAREVQQWLEPLMRYGTPHGGSGIPSSVVLAVETSWSTPHDL